jgi:hypothetical protein
MKLFTKLASAAGAIGLAATGALALVGTTPAAAHVPAVVRLTSTPAAPGQASPTSKPAISTVEATGTEALDTGAEAVTEPAGELQLPGGGHADPPGANVDHQFNGVE